MAFFCRHDWKVVDKTILPSAFQQLAEANRSPETLEGLTPSFFRTEVFVIVACSKCGKKDSHCKVSYKEYV